MKKYPSKNWKTSPIGMKTTNHLPPEIAAYNAAHGLVTVTRKGLEMLKLCHLEALRTQLAYEDDVYYRARMPFKGNAYDMMVDRRTQKCWPHWDSNWQRQSGFAVAKFMGEI